MSEYDSIILNGRSLRPAPYVSTSYEYTRSGNYIVGGFLIVTLSGTIVSEKINEEIRSLNLLQSTNDCINLIIGCSGNNQFLEGSGRIRSVDISQDNEPFVASYTIVIAIETIGGSPAVKPDDNFARSIGVPLSAIPPGIREYTETININGSGDILGSNDSGMMVAKSHLKASGSINMKINTNYLCGLPQSDSSLFIDSFLRSRCSAILQGIGDNNPLDKYTSWQKFLDSKSLEIQTDGNVTWQFDIYMNQSGGFNPQALADVTTTDKKDQKTLVRTRNISGSLKGISLASLGDHLGHKADSNERIGNATAVFNALERYLKNGVWPGTQASITGKEGENPADCVDECPESYPPICYQRISHSVTKSAINGEISFDMEFMDISACKPLEFDIETTIDDHYPATIVQEIVIPNRQIKPGQQVPRVIVQQIADSIQYVTITVRATLNGCDVSKRLDMIACARSKLNDIINREYPAYANWRYRKENENLGTYSYSITHERILCNYFI